MWQRLMWQRLMWQRLMWQRLMWQRLEDKEAHGARSLLRIVRWIPN